MAWLDYLISSALAHCNSVSLDSLFYTIYTGPCPPSMHSFCLLPSSFRFSTAVHSACAFAFARSVFQLVALACLLVVTLSVTPPGVVDRLGAILPTFRLDNHTYLVHVSSASRVIYWKETPASLHFTTCCDPSLSSCHSWRIPSPRPSPAQMVAQPTPAKGVKRTAATSTSPPRKYSVASQNSKSEYEWLGLALTC